MTKFIKEVFLYTTLLAKDEDSYVFNRNSLSFTIPVNIIFLSGILFPFMLHESVVTSLVWDSLTRLSFSVFGIISVISYWFILTVVLLTTEDKILSWRN